jgi:hypothetical protein
VPANTGAGGGGADAPTYNVSSGNGGGAGAYLEKMINCIWNRFNAYIHKS